MSSLSFRTIIVTAIASAMLVIPAAAFAGGATDDLSAVDSIASDVSVDGSNDSSASTISSASDSPTTDTYGSSEEIPPPVTCGSPSTDSGGSTKVPVDTSTSKAPVDTCSIPECSAADTDGKDANGKPCVECSSVDTDGKDASGQPCEPVTTTTEVPATTTEPVTGGGEVPEVAEPVAGGGTPIEAPEVIGGGAPELPFTGLPLWYAIYGGIGLMIIGGALWMRGHFGNKGA